MIELKPFSNNINPFYNWINDDEVIEYSLSLFQKISTKTEIDKWYKNLYEDESIYKFEIHLKNTNQIIGYGGICDICKINNSGELYLFIGEKELWGKGIGTEVTKLLLEFGFNNISLNRIFLTVSEPNIGGIKVYEKVGFIHEGKLREASFRNNKYHDLLIMSVLKNEWQK